MCIRDSPNSFDTDLRPGASARLRDREPHCAHSSTALLHLAGDCVRLASPWRAECVGVEMSDAATSPPGEQLTVRVQKCFRGESGSQFTLEVQLAVAAGFTILFGASGAGKTTLLDCVAGLQTPDGGTIAIGETVLFDSQSRVNLPPSRRSVAYLLQSLP